MKTILIAALRSVLDAGVHRFSGTSPLMKAVLVTSASRLLQAWKRLQVSYYGGKYSIHRLLALEAYSKPTTSLRVLIVCIATPIPMATVVILQELIPLQDPSSGWHANYGFWIRATVVTFVANHTIFGQAPYFIDGVAISTRQLVLLSASISTVFIACVVAIVSRLIFPVPFFILVFAPLLYICQFTLLGIILGPRIFRHLGAHRDQAMQYLKFAFSQLILVFVYPAYETLFRAAQGTQYQLPAILLLPAIKITMKNIVLRCVKHLEDMTPEAVIFTVDFFNAVYVATCMQSATSAGAVATIVAVDLGQTMTMLYGLHRHTAAIYSELRVATNPTLENGMLSLLTSLCREPRTLERQCSSGKINKHSCLKHKLSAADLTLLAHLDEDNQITSSAIDSAAGSPRNPSTPSSWRRSGLCCTQRLIYPVSLDSTDLAQKATTLQKALESLFTVECLVVASYLEAVVPFFFASYMLVMVHLPSAQYHAEMKGITKENVEATVLPVYFFGGLQVASFAVLFAMLKRNCGMRALYHLALVLESQMSLIQGKLMLWMLMTLCLRQTHFGVDFTFRNIAKVI